MQEVSIGSGERPLRVAIFGSGPSGFYAAEELLTQADSKVRLDMFDRLPTPYGLVRGGVAPDHQKIKSVIKVYEKTAARLGYRFFGNVEFGRDIVLQELRMFYDAVIFAIGAKSDRKMGIPGEDLKGSDPATIFVGWYNGHPDYQDFSFDLSCERVAVVGNGNVAVDVTRILARDPASLEPTDIADYALKALKQSKVKEIYMLGRRGPAQGAFTNPEVRELCNLPGADLVVDPKEMELDELSKEALAAGEGGTKAKNNVQILTEQSQKPAGTQPRKIILKFLVSPVEVLGKDGKVAGLKLEKNKLVKGRDGSLKAVGTGEFETLENVGLVFRSIGYKGVPLPGLPYDDSSGTIPNESGRVVDPQTRKPIPSLYVVGWAKRGPSGVIGTNKPDSIETVQLLLEDFKGKKAAPLAGSGQVSIQDFFARKNTPFVTYEDWKRLDEHEIERAKAVGKVREKFVKVSEMLAHLKNVKAAK